MPGESVYAQELGQINQAHEEGGEVEIIGAADNQNDDVEYGPVHSTEHVAVKQWENMDRFTLRLPEEVRRQIMSGKLCRTASCVGLPTEGTSRRGSNRGSLYGSGRFDRTGRSDRVPSLKSRKVTASAGGSVRSTKAADSVHGVVEPRLPPV
ncbi:hypothetical protein V2J09_007895 [Rumex salicifolius]